jgi:hypothetical protein
MGKSQFICKKLVDVPAMRPKEILTILYTDTHCTQFIGIKGEKETGKAIEFEDQLPILAQG